jgi:hypothetical protein
MCVSMLLIPDQVRSMLLCDCRLAEDGSCVAGGSRAHGVLACLPHESACAAICHSHSTRATAVQHTNGFKQLSSSNTAQPTTLDPVSTLITHMRLACGSVTRATCPQCLTVKTRRAVAQPSTANEYACSHELVPHHSCCHAAQQQPPRTHTTCATRLPRNYLLLASPQLGFIHMHA